ncbi:MAG: NADH-quinone oxidoreductase subunit NuoH [Candidatus Kapaibacteriales bacterium]
MSELQLVLLETGIKAFVVVNIILALASGEVYLERKISAWIQNRIGPNRVGPLGLLQPIADVVKLFFKEDVVPKAAHQGFHKLAPVLSLAVAVGVYAVIPYGHYVEYEISDSIRRVYMGISPNINIGALFILAMTSVGVYGITLAGWASNSKYSLLGGLRSAAQMISYELAMGLSLVAVVIIAGSLSLNDIIIDQSSWMGFRWNVFLQPVGFIIFLVSAFAETNRAPFDLPEAEPELVGGFNTEYSGMKFGMFFLAEYANMATASAFLAILYFGGWNLPFHGQELGAIVDGVQQYNNMDWFGIPGDSWIISLAQFVWMFSKILFFILFFIWVRWSIPRFRYDQLMNLGWKVLLPLSIVNVIITSLFVMLLDS